MPATTDVVVASSRPRSEEHTSELQSRQYLVCRLLLEKKNKEVRYKSTACSSGMPSTYATVLVSPALAAVDHPNSFSYPITHNYTLFYSLRHDYSISSF